MNVPVQANRAYATMYIYIYIYVYCVQHLLSERRQSLGQQIYVCIYTYIYTILPSCIYIHICIYATIHNIILVEKSAVIVIVKLNYSDVRMFSIFIYN